MTLFNTKFPKNSIILFKNFKKFFFNLSNFFPHFMQFFPQQKTAPIFTIFNFPQSAQSSRVSHHHNGRNTGGNSMRLYIGPKHRGGLIPHPLPAGLTKQFSQFPPPTKHIGAMARILVKNSLPIFRIFFII